MTVMPVAERMTAEQYLALPERFDGRRTQLIDGEIVMNEAGVLHQAVMLDILVAFRDWTRAAPGRGCVWLPLDVRIDDFNVFGPDILWYAEGGSPRRGDPRPSPLPDLVVEVRSPSTWRRDLGAKKSGYERRGLPELWLVDTVAEDVLVFRRSAPAATAFDVSLKLGHGDTLGSPAMPGFALALDVLFAPQADEWSVS